MSNLISIDKLIQQVQERDVRVQLSQRELVTLWIEQGLDMLSLNQKHSYTQENISEVTGVSQAQISLYITLASDKRLVYSIIATDKNTKHLERFNQKELKKLTTLNDVDFIEVVESGKFPKSAKEDKSIELPLQEQIQHKQEHIQQLEDEIIELQDELLNQEDKVLDVEVIEEDKSNTEVLQIPLTELSQKDLVSQAIAKAGTGTALAKVLGVKKGSVTNWKNENKNMSEVIREKILEYLE